MYGLETDGALAMTLTQIGTNLYNYLLKPLGIIAVMFLILLGVSKLWDPDWNIAIKITMIIVVFVTELACVFVLPFDIGKEARALFGRIWG